MRETDLRVIKTRALIKRTFLELLQERGMAKVTVTEIARRARIAKGTFYLHYHDVYELRDTLVQDALAATLAELSSPSSLVFSPAEFCDEFEHSIEASAPQTRPLFKSVDMRHFQQYLMEAITQGIFAEGKIERDTTNEVRLHALVGAFLAMAPLYYPKERDEMIEALEATARALFVGES